jgi:hypothetical protein
MVMTSADGQRERAQDDDDLTVEELARRRTSS